MKFEQAFYTRDLTRGLGIAASSKQDGNFIRNCDLVGANFNTEITEETAQFVFFSEVFQRYVGVGVSPAGYKDNAGVNKLVHIFVPEEDSENPAEYYLPYPFQRILHPGQLYSEITIPPVYFEKDFERILRKEEYHFERTKLAGLLYKILPVILGEKKLLAIVVSSEQHEKDKFPDIARELTWLIYQLFPAPDSEKQKFRRNLSYSVLSTVNISNANIAYVDNSDIHSNCFCLDEAFGEKIPEMYSTFAEYALKSREEYRQFIKELFEHSVEGKLSVRNLEFMFLQWKLQQENNSLKRSSLSVSLNTLIEMARKTRGNRILLYKIVAALDDFSLRELSDLQGRIFREVLKLFDESRDALFIAAYENALQSAYKKDYKLYTSYISAPDMELQEKIQTDIWESASGNSCIFEDIETIDQADAFLSKLNLYQGLWKTESFLRIMRSKACDQYYFDMNLENRQLASSLLDTEAENDYSEWKQEIRNKVECFFRKDSWTMFVEKEIGRIELPHYLICYMNDMLKVCQSSVEMPLSRERQKVCRDFFDYYRRDMTQEKEKEFCDLIKQWNREELQKRMNQKSVEELSQFSEFNDFPDDEREEFIYEWLDVLLSKAEVEGLSENSMRTLFGRKKEFAWLGERWTSEYTEQLWTRYSAQLRKQMSELAFAELAEFDAYELYLKEYEAALREDWCDEILIRLDKAQELTEKILETLVKRVEQIRLLGFDVMNAYETAVWEACRYINGSSNSLKLYLEMSYMFQELQFSVWDDIGLCDISSYRKICNILTARPEFQMIETTSFSKRAEFNRRCYIFWKQIEHMRGCSFKIFSDFDMTEYQNIFLEFLTSLQKEMLEQSDNFAITVYFLLEMGKEKYDTINPVKGARTKIERLRKLKSSNSKLYYAMAEVSKNNRISQGFHEAIRERLGEVCVFENLSSREKISGDNIEAMASLLSKAEKCFGCGIREIEDMQEEYQLVMDKLWEEQEEVQRRINEGNRSINQMEDEILRLQQRVKELRKKLDNDTRIRNKLKEKRDKAQRNRKGIPEMQETPYSVASAPAESWSAGRETDKKQGKTESRYQDWNFAGNKSEVKNHVSIEKDLHQPESPWTENGGYEEEHQVYRQSRESVSIQTISREEGSVKKKHRGNAWDYT